MTLLHRHFRAEPNAVFDRRRRYHPKTGIGYCGHTKDRHVGKT